VYKVVLLNLPVSKYVNMPSIGLTQLKSVLDEHFGRRVTTEIWYLNHDFVRYLGYDLHQAMLYGCCCL